MMLKDKNILLFAPSFFGYQTEIVNALKKMGANVDYFDERPKNNFIVKASIRTNKNLIKKRIIKYYTTILSYTKSKKYDFVFVVNLEALLPSIIQELRLQQTEAKFILYMWDSIQNKKPALEAFPYFDWGYSFDKSDSQKIEGINFRPLFFIDKYDADKIAQPSVQNIDLCFLGTVHSDRYNLIHNIKEQVENLGMKTFFFMYFPSPILFWYKKFKDFRFYKARYNEFSFTPLKLEEISEKIMLSKVILDIQHPKQSGLTMRTVEMLGANRKLITTNSAIKDYDFYDPENILVIDRDHPIIDKEFFIKPYKNVAPEIRNRYTIEAWIKELFKLS